MTSADTRRFSAPVEGDAEVHDHRLGIDWRVAAERGTGGELLSLNWRDALAHAWTQAEGGKHWRLPTVEELSSLIEIDEQGNPRYPDWMPNAERDGWYWSSTPDAGGSGHAWFVGFGGGSVGHGSRDDGNHVRLVRGVSRSVI